MSMLSSNFKKLNKGAGEMEGKKKEKKGGRERGFQRNN